MGNQVELWQIGFRLSAIGLIIGAFGMLLTGTAGPMGTALRMAIEPTLHRARQLTSLSRAELADATVLVAIALAVAAIVVEHRFLPGLVGFGLWLSRPSIRRITSEENRLFALAGTFSADLIVGFYAPIMVSQLLLGYLLTGGSLLAVMVALSWPAGGGAVIPGRRWQVAPTV